MLTISFIIHHSYYALNFGKFWPNFEAHKLQNDCGIQFGIGWMSE